MTNKETPSAATAMQDDSAPTLHRCLLAQRWRTLRALARANDLPFDSNWSKQQAAAALHSRLVNPTRVKKAVESLSAEARAALRGLLERGGQMDQTEFVHRFGPLRPYRPWRGDAPHAPWHAPISPTEELFYRGLIYPLNLGTTERPVPAIVLPSDLSPLLSQIFPPSPVSPLPRHPIVSPSPIPLLVHLFAFLSLLNREDFRPVHGRWLPPTALRRLAPLLTPCASEAEQARSELQVPYLAFLHYLAERAGWVAPVGGLLKPTHEAVLWMKRPPADRIRLLWDRWIEKGPENAALWRRYRLPLSTEDDPPARFRQMLDALSARPLSTPIDLTALLQELYEQDPALFRPQAPYRAWAALDEEARRAYRRRMESDLSALLTGPLAWFGATRLDDDRFVLTPLGAALLGRDEGTWPIGPPPICLHAHPVPTEEGGERTFLLEAQPAASPSDDRPLFTDPVRFALEGILPPDPGHPGRYRLTRSRLLHALQRGYTVEGIINYLEAAAGPLPPLWVGTLYRWAEDFGGVALRQVVVMETRDPALMQELTKQRRIRETLLESLSSRVVRVDGSRLDALIRRLHRRGIVPRLDLPGRMSLPGDAVSGEDRVLVATALCLYAHLADTLGLPARPVHAVVRAWSESLTLPQRDAVERQVNEVLGRLRRGSPDGVTPVLPVPTGPLIRRLEAAIAAGKTVEIEYYTAGRDHVTRRRVDPLRLEWRGEVAYLIAYCHLRGDQRVFRVDRIQRLLDGGG
ncbi:MAG TPA: WYL domain-containing protein [Thermoflexia bacterium]|nr:WYL domain-containing protein [Thermoflexia bacterium]